jgi:fructose-1,6-bisphosphatase/sedoheptulose 1,7-bisphosphatase-like protein
VHRHRRQPEGVATTCAIKALGGHIQGVSGRATTTRSSAASMQV